ncbi:MAG: ATP-binding cassette domain-containing protein [Gammaproteobacteria bacterium]|nr:ATP-binding cassette domain-containing protein [Gammaproteobacteria bacterium]
MSLLRLRNIQISYGAAPLFDGIDMTIEKGERLCLIGRNGAGKSTLMKLIMGEIYADDGEIVKTQGLRIARLIQEVPKDTGGLIYDVVAEGLGDIGALLKEYAHCTAQLGTGDESVYSRFEKLQHQIENNNGWDISQRIDTVLSRLGLDGSMDFSASSGGMKRRVLLAQALVQAPDILLLDEPTNHLDIDSVKWLEEFLLQTNITLLFITHDRTFLSTLATRIIELDRGKITSWPGTYAKYLEGKEAQLHAEEKTNADFDKKLAQEEVWIRQGVKARRTRNEGRVRALKAMRNERAERRERLGTSKLSIQSTDKSGKIVLEAENISHSFAGKPLIHNFSTTFLRGDKIGIIGANGCGKSTLLRILLGTLTPDSGTVKHGTKLEIAYFDQLRDALDENKTVADNIADGSDTVTINGQDKHVLSYLQDFLFPPSRSRQPVKALSGGERNRLLLAKLFTHSFNLLVLDEPTNDLDAETLDLLEEQLISFDGTLLLVSHDRTFLNNVVTSSIVFDNGTVEEFIGGYDDWQRQRDTTEKNIASKKIQKNTDTTQKTSKKAVSKDSSSQKKKLSYNDQRELDELPKKLETLENAIEVLNAKMSAADYYQQDGETMQADQQQLELLEQDLENAFARWEELDR